MAPFGLVTGWLLGRLARWRALLWALGPPLVLYAFHNWDLPVVACAVGAVYAMHGWRTPRPLRATAPSSPRCCSGSASRSSSTPARSSPRSRCWCSPRPGRGAAPRLAGRAAASRSRPRSRWCWSTCRSRSPATRAGARRSRSRSCARSTSPPTRSGTGASGPSPSPTNLAFQAGWTGSRPRSCSRRSRSRWRWAGGGGGGTGSYPWIGVSAAMLCGFLLLHKVHSPQYTLWLLPFFVLLRCRGAGSSPTWWPTSRCTSASSAVLPAQRRPRRRHRGRVRRAGRRHRGVGPGRAAGGAVRGVPAGARRRWSPIDSPRRRGLRCGS